MCVCVCQGHVDELWGLATHPQHNMFLTCSHDRQVCLWNAEDHKLDWCISLEVGRPLNRQAQHPHTHIPTTQHITKCVHCVTASTGVRLVCGLLPRRIGGRSGPLHWTVNTAVLLELRALLLNWWILRTISSSCSLVIKWQQ